MYTPVARTCRYGHGALELLMEWASLRLAQAHRPPADASNEPVRRFYPDGRSLAVRIWRCPTCGTIELADEE